MNDRNKVNGYHEIIDYFTARGRKTFSLKDIVLLKNGNENASRLTVSKLVKKGYVKRLAEGFYAIYSPSEKVVKEISPDLFIDQLMNFKNISYYVGLLSASSFYGGAHYRPMIYQVITNEQVRIPKQYLREIEFHVKKKFNINCIQKKKSEFGYINISSQALTIYDLVKYQKFVGTIENAFLSISELVKEVKITDFKLLLKDEIELNVIQRLGFILEKLGCNKLVDELLGYSEKFQNYVPLSLTEKIKGEKNNKWKIIINTNLEIHE